MHDDGWANARRKKRSTGEKSSSMCPPAHASKNNRVLSDLRVCTERGKVKKRGTEEKRAVKGQTERHKTPTETKHKKRERGGQTTPH